jgi:hypothetical protein
MLRWLQRIFIYPQVIILGVSLWKRDDQVSDYSLGLSIPGSLVAGYHYYGQMKQSSALVCRSGEAISPCVQRFVLEFGYITIPMLANTGAQPGDALVLTKPLGIGFIATAAKLNEDHLHAIAEAIRLMCMLNKTAATC